MSNVSWLTDNNAYTSGGSLEMDFYGGFRGSIGKSDFGYDVGLLQYYYPGDPAPGLPKADTLEAYAALSWKWLSAKYSYSLNNKTFGVTDSSGTYYLDLSATVPLGDTGLTGIAHYGIQKFDGTGGCGIVGQSNDACASFNDWKIGLSYALPKDFTIGAFYTGTDMDDTAKPWYTNVGQNKFWGKDTGTVFISKTF